MAIRTFLSAPLLVVLAASAIACSSARSDQPSDDDTSDDALTSVTALARTLRFDAYVYVDASASDDDILAAAKMQNKSAFGALRTANVGVNDRELGTIDTKTFSKQKVTVIDTDKANDPGRPMLKVTYRYTNAAVVPKTMASRSAQSLAVLGGDYGSQADRILTECTENDSEAKEFTSDIWYVFNPGLDSCNTAMTAEQKKIDADTKKLQGDKTKVALSEVNRLYKPVTMSLDRARLNGKASYPEYDRLYSGGVKPGYLVVGMVSGLMADWAAGEVHATSDDPGWPMWFGGLKEIFSRRPGFQMTAIAPSEDLTKLTANGKTYSVPGGFMDIMKWVNDGTGYPAGATDDATQKALQEAAAQKILKHWVTFEVPVTVTIGSAPPKKVTIQLNSYFGAEEDDSPHKQGIKNSDIFVYNGHSYIGYGPLDPSRYTSSDFPSTYQVMSVNGCVSYNYYEHDYFPLKSGGTKNLELITNGLESWVDESGPAMGRLVGTILDGKQESYTDILKAAQFTYYGYDWGMDALRVVDGELDNKYFPDKTPITVQ